MRTSYTLPADLPPDIQAKLEKLAGMLVEKKPTPTQLKWLCTAVAKETGFPVSLVRACVVRAQQVG